MCIQKAIENIQSVKDEIDLAFIMNDYSNVIQKHKGTIDVESEVGKGTTFRIRIPVNEVPKVN